MKKFFLNLFINLSIIITTLIIISVLLNWNLLFRINQSNFLFSKFDQNRMSYLQRVFFPDTYNNFTDDYALYVGDSYAYSGGDSHLNGDYDYGIAHQYFNKSGTSVFNAALPGNDSPKSVLHTLYLFNLIENSFFLKGKIKSPKKIFFFFYEGNDIVHNARPRYKNFSKITQKCHDIDSKQLSLKDLFFESNFYFLRFFYYNINHQLNLSVQKGNLVSLLKIILPRDVYMKLESKFGVKDISPNKFNKIKFSNNTSHLTGFMQFPPTELNDSEISLSFDVLDASLKCLNSKFKHIDKYFVYIPSPTIFYDYFDEKLILQSDFDDDRQFLQSSSELKNLSNIFELKANKVALNNDLKIIDVRNNLLKLSKNQLIHGSIDIHHFNKIGYHEVANTLINFELKNN